MKAAKYILLGCLLALSACQTAPTKVRENPERKIEGVERQLEAIKLTPQTVVIDARSAFEYSVAHIPRSINLQWSEFSEREAAQKGILQSDLFAAARRLARAGVGPATPVVVVGSGLNGQGEEGRIAWTLAYLGVRQVQFAQLDSLRARVTNAVGGEGIAAVEMWKPEPAEVLNVTQSELKSVINNNGVHQPIALTKADQPTLYRIIDVRSARDYMGKEGFGARNSVPNMDAINIPWQEFFEPSMRPNRAIYDRLIGVNIRPEYRIIVLGEDGVSSAAVTMALQALGFKKAGNYSGGLKDLLSSRR